MRTRAEHLQWAKDRAMEYVNAGDLQQAFASIASDLRKHPGTANHEAAALGFQLLMSGHLDTADKMTRWIQGYQ